MNIEKIRNDFPILKRKINGKNLIYFDNTATSQKPIQVINAIKEFYEKYNANIHRGVHTLSQEASEMYEDAHKKVAKFIGSKHIEEIIFVKNATEAVNLFMYSYVDKNLKPGDEILTTAMEHHSNLVPWQFLEKKKGIKLKIADVNDNGTLKIDQFEQMITDKTKLITVTQVSNVTGVINDIKKIRKMKKDAILLVDGAQSVPHMPVDVKEIGCDFLVFSAHKMLGPTGIGALFGKKELLEKMSPFIYGGDMIREVKLHKATFNTLPWKFEAGTPNMAGGVGFAAAIDYLEKIRMKNVRNHEKDLTSYILDKLDDKKLTLFGPKDPEKRGGVISFNIKGSNHHDVASLFNENGIAIRSGYHCAQPLVERLKSKGTCRASFYIYNTKQEVDIFLKELNKIKQLF